MKRFANLNLEDINNIVLEKDSKNTQKVRITAIFLSKIKYLRFMIKHILYSTR